ncbi:MAG TPA: response regulator [Candidatus Nitrosotenuis sp.]|nr:response regulator [Candidatus Nitrosotenuis sp.]
MHTVLIVEDHALVAKFYRLALERAGGFECMVTEDVPAMLAALAEGRVHVAVVDVSLNEARWEGRRVDGVELTRLLKAHAEKTGRPLPVLLSTAHAMAGDRERLLAESGADDYLEKPVYEAAQLVDKVRALLKSAP